jgi:hypothetical protein
MEKKKLPSIVGFCQYRKYFHWFDDVPDLKKWVERYGCLVSQAKDLNISVYRHYNEVGNTDDLDIVTSFIIKKYPYFEDAWLTSINHNLLHPCSMFIMRAKDAKMMISTVLSIVDDYVRFVGKDIDNRINSMPEKYHMPYSTIDYQRRIGGQLCERLVSAWIDWRFPKAEEIPVRFTEEAII